jgi:hypothetical protein
MNNQPFNVNPVRRNRFAARRLSKPPKDRLQSQPPIIS